MRERSELAARPDDAVQIFISYARADDIPVRGIPGALGFVEFLYAWLNDKFQRSGPIRPFIWRYVDHTSPAEPFPRRLEAELRKSQLLLVVLSGNWMASRYCRNELKYFKDYRKRVNEPSGERIIIVEKNAMEVCRGLSEQQNLESLFASLLMTSKRLRSRKSRPRPAKSLRA
jgi:hypothetical protein